MSPNSQPASGAVSILFIDGHHEDRIAYALGLKACSSAYVIHEAADGKSALDLYGPSIDCVILELALPDMSGFEVLFQLVPNPRRPGVAVVVLTRLNHLSLLEVATTNGAQKSLSKSQTTVGLLDKAILHAISGVQRGLTSSQ